MSRILDNLYLGSYGDARNLAFLKKCGITHILTVGVELQALYPQNFRYLCIPAYDHPSFQLAPYFDQIADFIHNAIEKDKGTVFVHCQMGISRSTTSVISYLVKYHRMHPVKAGQLVKSRRAIVYPNPGFLYQLDNYAKKLGVNEDKPALKSLSSTASNGFGLTNRVATPKKEDPVVIQKVEVKQPEVKTLAMTSSAWKPASSLSSRDSERRTMSMSASNWKANVNVKEESKFSDNEKVVSAEKEYCCKTCGTKLFNSSSIEHDSNSSGGYCTMIYVKYMNWIGVSKNSSAKIYCPNGKCNTIIGFSNVNGGKCPCGKRIERMYGVYPLKLTNAKNKMGETLRAW